MVMEVESVIILGYKGEKGSSSTKAQTFQKEMYKDSGSHGWVLVPHSSQEIEPDVTNAVYDVGSNLIKGELGAYGEKIFGSGSAYVQTNISKYFSNPQYYFQVNDDYVKNKLKVVLFPFLHKGHWMRTREQNGGEFSYKPPIYDINAPDLYIPLMAFGTYVVLAGFSLGIHGKFSPEALGVQFTNGLLCWLLQVLLLESTLHTLGGGGEIPVLDMVAYGGYTFPAACIIIIAKMILGSYCFVAATFWESLCMGVLLVKTMKRILVAEVKCFQKVNGSISKRHYILLLMAVAQFPLLFWLGNVGN